MKAIFEKAAEYEPGRIIDFIMALYDELPINEKALFKAVFIEYFLQDTLLSDDNDNV